MANVIETKCINKGVRLTDQRKLIAKVMSESEDHPNVDELHKRVNKLDTKISIATVYRTVKLFEEAGILAKHDFKGNKSIHQVTEVIKGERILVTFNYNVTKGVSLSEQSRKTFFGRIA